MSAGHFAHDSVRAQDTGACAEDSERRRCDEHKTPVIVWSSVCEKLEIVVHESKYKELINPVPPVDY